MQKTVMITVRNILLGLILCILAGFVLEIAVFGLPVKRMEMHVKESVHLFEREGAYNYLILDTPGTTLDNYTDCAMLMQAIYDGNESVWNKAMNVYSRTVNDLNYTDTLIQYSNTGHYNNVKNYFWYWHGYMIFLKPLLLFCHYGEIRVISMTVQFVLFLAVLYAMIRRNLKEYVIPYVVVYLFMMPFTLALSLQFTACFDLMNLVCFLLLWFYDKLQEKKMFYMLFLFTGAATSFFDYLTYPLVTIGIPLIMLFLCNRTEKTDWLSNTKITVANGISWVIGYVGMWGGKWLLASIVLRQNCFAKAIERILLHTGVEEGGDEIFTLKDVFYRNFMWVQHNGYRLILALLVLYCVIMLVRARGADLSKMLRYCPLLLIALMPVAWYIVVSTHSFYHYWMEYREFVVCIFAVSTYLLLIRKEKIGK